MTGKKKGKSAAPAADFRALLREGCRKLGLEPDVDAIDRLQAYFDELKKWSRKINLIAKESTDLQIVENHFLDSLTLLPHLAGENVHLLDVGTGAGFPGLVCKAARPEIELTLVEPRLKRVSFLRHVVRTLSLADVGILACRIEDEALLPSGTPFTHITSRAVNEIVAFLPMAARFLPARPAIVCMKGPKWAEELAAAEAAVRSANLELVDRESLRLPFSGAERTLLVFKTLAE